MFFLYVGLGGAIGAIMRYSLSLFLPMVQGGFPWATWCANIIGCACAGIFFACAERHAVLQQEARLFLMVGILGGFTTFSSFGLETFQMIKHAAYGLAISYVLSSVLFGLMALASTYVVIKFLIA